MQDLYDLLLLLASFVPPAPAYKGLPQDVVEGVVWTWIVIVYGVFLAVAVTTFSVRVLGLGTSTRCLPTVLRVLLVTASVVSEVFAAIYLMPATTLTVVGACFTVLLLLAAHLFACRRRRHPRTPP